MLDHSLVLFFSLQPFPHCSCDFRHYGFGKLLLHILFK